MTEHYTMHEAVKLAEKELEVVRLHILLSNIKPLLNDGPMKYLIEFNLSTPSSTKHLDEYVEGKVKELEKDALFYRNALWKACGDDKESVISTLESVGYDAIKRSE